MTKCMPTLETSSSLDLRCVNFKPRRPAWYQIFMFQFPTTISLETKPFTPNIPQRPCYFSLYYKQCAVTKRVIFRRKCFNFDRNSTGLSQSYSRNFPACSLIWQGRALQVTVTSHGIRWNTSSKQLQIMRFSLMFVNAACDLFLKKTGVSFKWERSTNRTPGIRYVLLSVNVVDLVQSPMCLLLDSIKQFLNYALFDKT